MLYEDGVSCSIHEYELRQLIEPDEDDSAQRVLIHELMFRQATPRVIEGSRRRSESGVEYKLFATADEIGKEAFRTFSKNGLAFLRQTGISVESSLRSAYRSGISSRHSFRLHEDNDDLGQGVSCFGS